MKVKFDRLCLEKIGFENHQLSDYVEKKVTLRDGRLASLWVNKSNGHGILDPNFWEDTGSYYESEYRQDFSADLHNQQTAEKHLKIYENLNRRQFAQFSNLLSNNTSFLEIGCSFGGILRQVYNANVSSCHAIEPNQADALYNKEELKEVSIFNSTFETVELAENYYDLIVSFEVLEHVLSPRQFIKKACSLLKYNGTLHLEVPNHHDALMYIYNLLGYNKFYYHKAHIHYFTPMSLQELCEEEGLQGFVKGFQMYPFFNQMHWLLHDSPMTSAIDALRNFQQVVPNFDTNQMAVKNFFNKFESEYNELVENQMISDCLIYQGTRKND